MLPVAKPFADVGDEKKEGRMRSARDFLKCCILCLFLSVASISSFPTVIFASDADDVADTGGQYLSPPEVDNVLFAGSANNIFPIEVPPGRNGMTPKIALTYNSQRKSGWVGKGWDLEMGYIQRSTKWGLHYEANDYVAYINGSTVELVARPEWGANYYGAKIEGAFSRFYYNLSTKGWEVTAKDGTKYYYGQTAVSRQDFGSPYYVFKWCLDMVKDTNGNYMTLVYTKSEGQVYLDRIDYAGHLDSSGQADLAPRNYVKFDLQADDPTLAGTVLVYYGDDHVQTKWNLGAIKVLRL